ncbi:MAG: hypothetical protein HY685_05805 [Chloroflexi bacterium]|nr:hypothetical protein [Chloroflexota bacterium]
MKMRVFDHERLVALNGSSIQSGRGQNLPAGRLPTSAQDRYWVSAHAVRDRDGQQEVRLCVVLDLFRGQTAWLDVSSEEFAAIPEIDVSADEWETAMCAGTPPVAP